MKRITEKRIKMKRIKKKRITKSLGIVIASLVLLTSCSSGSSSSPESGVNTQTNVPGDTTDATVGPENQLIGTWVLCGITGGLRFEYTFTRTTYTNSTGTGSCAGFDQGGAGLVATGTYALSPSTTLSDSGLESLTIDFMQDTLNGATLSESLRQTIYQIVYIETPGQIFFSDPKFNEEDRSLTLNLNAPYVRQ